MTKGRVAILASLLLIGLLLQARAAVEPSEAERHFLEKVKPLLESRCVSCHGPEKQKGHLRLDSREATLKGGEVGPSVVPGRPAESLLLQAVKQTHPDLAMPPKDKLSSQDVAVIERWIRDGAPWPSAPAQASTPTTKTGDRIGDAWSDTRNPIVKIFGGQRLDLWSLKPIKHTDPPAVKNGAWPRNAIDRFILAKLEASNLSPAPEADRRTLIRRLSFDLTGLPPTPEEVEEFGRDDSAGAYEALVDRLLASPRYGEHQARQWLDVVRYSDSNGFDWDEFRPQAWRFRDYVIRSFNADKPFDQFVREQLAGDELLDGPPKTKAEQDMLIATGYLRLGPHDNAAPLFNEQARSRAELMADMTETTGSAFLGLTMSCCRCHDHKFDPLSQADHYRLRAFFEGVKFADDVSIDLAADQEQKRKHNEAVEAEIKKLQEEHDAPAKAAEAKLREKRVAELAPDERELLALPGDKVPADKKQARKALQKKVKPSDDEVKSALSTEEKESQKALAERIDGGKKRLRPLTKALLMTDAEGEPAATKVLFQGDYRQERDAVQPGFISALDPNPASIAKAANPKTTGRRLTLANWIVSRNNTLTARVIVNRIWQGHFGKGLVATPNDFGLAGARPTHPELLDNLASEFVREGWSVKRLHRAIVTSATYRQAAVVSDAAVVTDANDDLLWRQHLRRLSSEQLRDALLEVSGLLQQRDVAGEAGGGPPVWPELPSELLTANPALLDDNAEKTKGWYPSPKEDRHVRSIYEVQKRTVKLPFMETFDQPENGVSCPRRNVSTVAPQALAMMNGTVATEAAKALAVRVEKDAGAQAAAQVRRAFELTLQRAPDSQEERRCVDALKAHSLAELCRVLLNLNEFVYVD